jgi:8-oxo-dGTP diphosphatase
MFDTNDNNLKLNLAILLIAYKRIRGNIDHTDIIFKFMGDSFTLEDVRMVYELIMDKSVDKSNFRKKIVKYCEKTTMVNTKAGYRPSQRYKFKPIKEDIWL